MFREERAQHNSSIGNVMCHFSNREPTPAAEIAPQGVTWPTAGAITGNLTYYVLDHAPSPAQPVYDVRPLRIRVVPGKFKERIDFWDSLPLKENQEY
jgi:hypothetical protein